jgi:hypothetical protein
MRRTVEKRTKPKTYPPPPVLRLVPDRKRPLPPNEYIGGKGSLTGTRTRVVVGMREGINK